MADNDNTNTYVRETRTTEGSGTSLALIVGGLVVAVFFVVWLVFGGNGPAVTSTPANDTTNVTVEAPAAPADTTTNVTVEPAPDAPAPDATPSAEPAAPAAPADGTAAPAAPPANP